MHRTVEPPPADIRSLAGREAEILRIARALRVDAYVVEDMIAAGKAAIRAVAQRRRPPAEVAKYFEIPEAVLQRH